MPKALIFADEEFDDVEVSYPKQRLRDAGFTVDVATKGRAEMYGKKGAVAGATTDIKDVKVEDYDLVIVPGGYRSPDRLRTYDEVLNFIKEMDKAKKVVAAICHGLWVLISAGIVKDRTMTGHRGTRDDLINAGANYVDEEAVIDGNLVTSRHPRDVAAFTQAVLSKFK